MSAAFSGNVYLVYEDERTTFADAHQRVRAVAHWLASQGVGIGDRVAIANAQLPRVCDRLLGHPGARRGRRSAERVVDRTRTRVRTQRFRRRRALRRRRARRTHRAPPRRDRGAHDRAHSVRSRRAQRGRMGRRRERRRPDASARRDRRRCGRGDHVHVGHHRSPEGCRADEPQLRQLPDARRVSDDRGGGSGWPAVARRATARCRWRRCSRSRSSTSADCTRSCCRTRRPAARSS